MNRSLRTPSGTLSVWLDAENQQKIHSEEQGSRWVMDRSRQRRGLVDLDYDPDFLDELDAPRSRAPRA
jgi:hypothetical protein